MADKFEIFRDELFVQAKTKGFSDYELYYLASKGFSVRVFKGEISEFKNSITEGVGFRGTYNGKMGYAYSENLDTGIIASLLDNACGNAGIIEEDEVEKLFPGSDKYPTVNNFNPALDTVDASQKIAWAMEMEKYTLSLDPKVTMADFCTIATNEYSMALANSHGLNLSSKGNMAYAIVVARVEENGVTKSASEIWRGRDFAEFNYKTLAETAVKTALSYLGATSIPSDKYPVLFNQDTAQNILGVFTGVFKANNCQKGMSLLNKSRLGEVIAAPHVTLRDDGVTELSLNSSAFDSEGVATTNKAVIENGVLKTLLHNTKSAAKDGVSSTGNASKQGYSGVIEINVTNFYLVPGSKSYDDIVKGMEKGVILTDLAGLHAGVNAVSGDFSLSAGGYLVENGKRVKPVEQITVAGNFYELLKNIEDIGSDLRFNGNGIGSPSFLVSGLNIAGL